MLPGVQRAQIFKNHNTYVVNMHQGLDSYTTNLAWNEGKHLIGSN